MQPISEQDVCSLPWRARRPNCGTAGIFLRRSTSNQRTLRSPRVEAIQGDSLRGATGVLVIGGGPAGLAAGIAPRMKGFYVTLVDGAQPPPDQAFCGRLI